MSIEEALEKLLKFFGQIQQAKDAESPGGAKVTLTEYPGLAISAVQLVPVFGAIKELGESVENMTDEEKQSLKDKFKTDFDLPNDEVEEKIERIFDWVVDTADMIYDLKDVSVKYAALSDSQPGGPGNPDDGDA